MRRKWRIDWEDNNRAKTHPILSKASTILLTRLHSNSTEYVHCFRKADDCILIHRDVTSTIIGNGIVFCAGVDDNEEHPFLQDGGLCSLPGSCRWVFSWIIQWKFRKWQLATMIFFLYSTVGVRDENEARGWWVGEGSDKRWGGKWWGGLEETNPWTGP